MKRHKEYVFQEECTGKIADLPELNKVRKLMRDGAINVLAVFDASRFARKIGVADIFAPNPTNEYLCSRFIRCKRCEYSVYARTTTTRGHIYRYYNCGSYEAADENKRGCRLKA